MPKLRAPADLFTKEINFERRDSGTEFMDTGSCNCVGALTVLGESVERSFGAAEDTTENGVLRYDWSEVACDETAPHLGYGGERDGCHSSSSASEV